MALRVGGMFASMSASWTRWKSDMDKARSIARSSGRGIQNSLNGMRKSGMALSGAMSTLTKRLGAVAAGYAGLSTAKAAVKDFMDFEKAMTAVNTILRVTPEQLKVLSKQAREAAVSVGDSPAGFANAMYQAVSAGVQYDKVIEFVTASTKLAKAGFTDTTTAVDLLSTTVNAYGDSAGDLNHVLDVLLNTQNRGKTTIGRLAESMGQAIPTAAALGVNFDVLTAALQAMTANGIDTATAVTSMRAMLVALAGPTEQQRAEFYKMAEAAGYTGIKWNESRLKGDGLVSLLRDMYKVTGGSVEALGKLGINQRSLNATLTLGGKSFDFFTESIKSNNEALGVLNDSFGMVSDDMSFKLEQLKASWENLNIAIVEGFGPEIKSAIDSVTQFINALSKIKDGEDRVRQLSDETAQLSGDVDNAKLAIVENSKAIAEYSKGAEDAKEESRLLAIAIENGVNPVTKIINKLAEEKALRMAEEYEREASLLSEKNEELENEIKFKERLITLNTELIGNKMFEQLKDEADARARVGEVDSLVTWTMRTNGLERQEVLEEEASNEEEVLKERLQEYEEFYEKINELANNTANFANQLEAYQTQVVQNEANKKLSSENASYEKRKAALIAKYTVDGQITEEGQAALDELTEAHYARQETIENDAAAQSKKIAKKLWAIKVAAAISDTAAAVVKTLKAYAGKPIPGYAIAQAAIIGAAGLAEVATIRAQAYAKGGVVNAPIMFPTSTGMALAGEAGAEAILPLDRTASGDLGVKVSGRNGGPTLVQHIYLSGNVMTDEYIEYKVGPTIEKLTRKGLSKIQVKN